MEHLFSISMVIYLRSSVCSSCARRLARSSGDKKGKSSFGPRHQLTTPRRHFSSSLPRALQPETEPVHKGRNGNDQVYALKGYYSEILATPSPTVHTHDKPDAEEPSPAEKASIVFGSRLAGPGYSSSRYHPTASSPESTWRRVNGVAIPPRPEEPDNCCMSGCVHCVWDDYRSEVESWAARVQEAKNRQPQKESMKVGSLIGRDMKQQGAATRDELASASSSMDDDGGGSETNWDPSSSGIGDELFSNIPVGIREFMRTEKRLKEKHLRNRNVNRE